MKSVAWLSFVVVLAIAYPVAVGAFGVGSGGLPIRPTTQLQSTPGGWENDEFLNSLGGGGGGGEYNPMDDGDQQPVERIAPQNDMSDEEITQMAMRAAQFYNTDTSIEEAYGTPRKGPPRKQQEEEDYEGEFQ